MQVDASCWHCRRARSLEAGAAAPIGIYESLNRRMQEGEFTPETLPRRYELSDVSWSEFLLKMHFGIKILTYTADSSRYSGSWRPRRRFYPTFWQCIQKSRFFFRIERGEIKRPKSGRHELGPEPFAISLARSHSIQFSTAYIVAQGVFMCRNCKYRYVYINRKSEFVNESDPCKALNCDK